MNLVEQLTSPLLWIALFFLIGLYGMYKHEKKTADSCAAFAAEIIINEEKYNRLKEMFDMYGEGQSIGLVLERRKEVNAQAENPFYWLSVADKNIIRIKASASSNEPIKDHSEFLKEFYTALWIKRNPRL